MLPLRGGKKMGKKILCTLLVSVMLLTSVDLTAFATEVQGGSETESTTIAMEDETEKEEVSVSGDIITESSVEEEVVMESTEAVEEKIDGDVEKELLSSEEQEEVNELNDISTEIETEEQPEETEQEIIIVEEVSMIEDSGQCGDNLIWTLKDGILTISGTGAMWDYSKPWTACTSAPWEKYAQEKIKLKIEEGITKIGSYAFNGCSGFTGELIIPESVTEIGERAFGECSGFTGSLIIPDSVTKIGNDVFYSCRGFDKLSISKHITEISAGAFMNCSGLKGELKISDGVTKIGGDAFSYCSGFTGGLIIPDSVIEMGESVFENCDGLTGNLKISDGITEIKSRTFRGCNFTGELKIPVGVTKIGYRAFEYCDFTGAIIIPDGVIVIDSYAFDSFDSKTSIIFRGNAPFIDSTAFAYASIRIYYPSYRDGWEETVGNYSGYYSSLTWIPYTEGNEPWLMNQDPSSPSLWIIFDNDLQDLSYSNAEGYSQKNFILDISVHYMSVESGQPTYENVVFELELPEGLSLSDGANETFYSINLGNIDNLNSEVKFSIPIYITGEVISDKFTITARTTADDFANPQERTYGISCSMPDNVGTVFNIYKYRADKLHSDGYPDGWKEIVDMNTPCDILIPLLQENGFDNLTGAWEKTSAVFDTMNDVTALYDFVVKEKDIYAAIILDALAVSKEYGTVDIVETDIKGLKEFSSVVTQWAKNAYKIDIADDYSFQNLSHEQKEKIVSLAEDYYDEYVGKDLQSVNQVVKNFGTMLEGVDNIEAYVGKVAQSLAMANLCESMKTVVRTMYDNCPSSNYSMKLALAECVEIMDSKTEQFIAKMIVDGVAVGGENAAKYLVGKMWDDVKASLNAGFPALDIILAGYKAGKFISNSLFNTDASIEQYHKMLAIREYETLLNETWQTLNNLYITESNEKNAAAYLSALDLIFAFRDQDCINAYEFVDTLDQAMVNKIAQVFHGEGDSDNDKIKSSISSLQRSYYSTYEDDILSSWVSYLETDYPGKGLAEKYYAYLEESHNRKITKEYLIACPVDVYIYDASNNLVASVKNNRPYCNGNLTVVVSEDEKAFYFYDDIEYRMECIGNDTGTMDIRIYEYGSNESITRSAFFYDLPLQNGKKYETTVDGKTGDANKYFVSEDDGSIIFPDLDTQVQMGNTILHKLKVNSGSVVINGELRTEAELYTNEAVEIRAFVADGYEFDEWISDYGLICIEDSGARITSLRMPDADISITAMLKDADGNIIDPSQKEDEPIDESVTVTFETMGGTEIEPYVAIAINSTIILPVSRKENYKFSGWFTEPNGQGIEFTEETPVTGNITLYAYWIPEEDVPEGLWVGGIVDQIYTGKPIKPVIQVYDGITLLQEKRDYIITYKNNTKANDATNAKTAPTITVTGKGNYAGKETVTFAILPKDISESAEDISTANITVKESNKVQKPVPVVQWGTKKLKNKTDFTVEYPNATEGAYQKAGTYQILVKGKGNYAGERIVTLTITPNTLISKATVAKIANQPYTGSEIEPAITVKYGKTVLKVGTDYEVSYENNTEIGTATAILTGLGSYSGEKRITFKITGGSISKAKVSGLVTPKEYTGEEIIQDCTLTVAVNKENRTLKEGIDYIVSYQKNKDVGTASVIFTGINGYSGTLKKTFKITAYDLVKDSNEQVRIEENLQSLYVKGGSKPKPIVTFGSRTLQEGVDYKLTYRNHATVNDGNDPKRLPTVIITGKGNFRGTRNVTFVIVQQDIGNLKLTVADKVYQNKKNVWKSGISITDLDGKKLVAGKDYSKAVEYTYEEETLLADGTKRNSGDIIGSSDILPHGTVVRVTAVGLNNYNGTLSGTYRIAKSNIGKATVKVQSQIYTGQEIRPDKDQITVKIGKVELDEADYEIVSYSNNVKKGTATMIVRGVGDYGGTKSVRFIIKSKGFLWWWRKLLE